MNRPRLHAVRLAARVAVTFLVACAGHAFAQGSAASDRAALVALYDAADGTNWTNSGNWKTAAPLGEWHGVTTDGNGRVTVLYLDRNKLSGAIPPSLSDLSQLQVLALVNNELDGPIPAWLGNLSNLTHLFFGGNALDGPIPFALGRLSKLQHLNLAWNDLSGPIPSTLGDLSELRTLTLWGNALSGPIPSVLGNLPHLERLSIWYNWGLTGPLPAGLRQAPLVELDVFLTQACAPREWRMWLRSTSIDFNGALCGAEQNVTIDVAVVYTPAAREAAGGINAIEAVIDLMVAQANQTYADSAVRQRLALVAREEVRYAETGDSGQDLRRLREPSDGHMDGVHALRDRAGADLVHLIVDADKANVGGIAGYGAFGLTVHSALDAGTFTHEIGHNLGLDHERYDIHTRGKRLRAGPAYGYLNQRAFEVGAAPARRWRTVMAGSAQCEESGWYCPRVLRFSNARQTLRGDPLGVPYSAGGGSGLDGPADAAAVLAATGPAVALWRDRLGSNRPPTAVGELPDHTLTRDDTVDVDVSRAFVDPDGDVLSYAVSSSEPQVVTVLAAGARVSLTAVGMGTATVWVTATDPGGLSVSQSFVVTVTVTVQRAFSDHPIVPGETPVRALHFRELRSRIDALRVAAGLERFAWADPVVTPGVTPVRLVHLVELRSALAEAYSAAGRSAPRWTDGAPAGGATPIRAAHLMELRAAVVALE